MFTLIFADGASSGNPGPGGWGTIVVFPEGTVRELGGRNVRTTNNQMELQAVIAGVREVAHTPGGVRVYTDSTYVIRGITQWIWAWRTTGWKTAEGKDVANADLWKELFALVAKRGREDKVEWHFVRGHSGVPGNERVDEIAVLFSQGKRPALYDGPLLRYNIAVHDVPEVTELPEMKPRREPEPAFSYLSVVGDQPMRHASWADCERRVKGRSGAKFKKAKSAEEEKAILHSWGYSLSDLKS